MKRKLCILILLFGTIVGAASAATAAEERDGTNALLHLGQALLTDMSAYGQYGLVYDLGMGGYCYDGRLVGLFADSQGKGIVFLNQDGEVHVKVIRDDNGDVAGLTELSAEEYDAIIAELESMRAGMQERMNEMRRSMEERMNEDGSMRADMQEQMRQSRAEMEQRLNSIVG